MSDSEFPHDSMTRLLAANHSAFRIILRDIDGYEGIESREFDLSLGGTFPIGRASKNTTKKDLMPAASNAYIDSPVISRDHAVLSANAQLGTPHVFITDAGSMHGTMVNGERLPAHKPKQLASGDKLQFGIDVNRNEGTHVPHRFPCSPSSCNADMASLPEFFVARKYQFESHLARPQAPFSLGFTVPDSDEEEVGGTTLRQGSQNNPLTIDESDSESDISENENADLTMMRDGFIVVDDDDDDDDGEEEPPAVASIPLLRKSSPSVDKIAVVEEDYFENDVNDGYYSSDAPDDDLNDEGSVLPSGSELDYNSDLEVSDDEVVPTPVPTNIPLEAAPKHVGLEVALEHSELSFPTPDLPPRNTYSTSAAFESVQPELPSMDMIRESHDAFINSFPPPLPPRPAAAQPSMFDRADPSSSRPPWFSDEIASYPNYMGTNHGDRPILFSPAPVPPYMPSSQEMKNMDFGARSVNLPPFASRMQTPPPMQPSDVTTSTTPPPSRRTKVSIGEIVEEQPLTPTSVNNMKRKAGVLDESDASIADVSSRSESLDSTGAEEPAEDKSRADPTPAQTAAIIAQRPKKQPRSILGKLRTTATYLGVGAAGAAGMVALLSSLPDAFFA
jgi:hypothetical protein